MLWTLDFDDYTGQFCNEGTFPIANAIKSVFDEFSVTTTATSAITTTTTTTESSSSTEKNENEGSKIMVTESAGENSALTTTSSKLGFFIGSGDVVFSGSINGISIGYDSSYGAALPPSLVNANSNSSNSSTTQVVVDDAGGLQNSTASLFSFFYFCQILTFFSYLIFFLF